MAVDDLYRCEINWATGNSQWQNILYYRETAGTFSADTMNAFCSQLNALLISTMLPEISDQVILTTVEFYGGPLIERVPGAIDNQTSIKGSQVGDLIQANSCAIFQWRTTAPSGRYNGRMYISGITEAQCVDGIIGTTAVQDLQVVADMLASPVLDVGAGDVDFVPVVLHKDQPVTIPPTYTPYDVTAGICLADLYTRRARRRTGRGVAPSPP